MWQQETHDLGVVVCLCKRRPKLAWNRGLDTRQEGIYLIYGLGTHEVVNERHSGLAGNPVRDLEPVDILARGAIEQTHLTLDHGREVRLEFHLTKLCGQPVGFRPCTTKPLEFLTSLHDAALANNVSFFGKDCCVLLCLFCLGREFDKLVGFIALDGVTDGIHDSCVVLCGTDGFVRYTKGTRGFDATAEGCKTHISRVTEYLYEEVDGTRHVVVRLGAGFRDCHHDGATGGYLRELPDT